MEYTVIWEEEIEATSPEMAVSKALKRLEHCYVGGAKKLHNGEQFQVEWKSQQTHIIKTSTREC